jgi:hypothetical protein
VGPATSPRWSESCAAWYPTSVACAIFATAEQTAERLEAAGFTDVETWLHDEPTPFATRADLERFMATVILWPQLGRLTPEKGAAFVARVVDELGSLELDYVRLNLRARRR